MTPDTLQLLQGITTLLGLGAIGFALGKLYGRIDALCVSHSEIKAALFGRGGIPGGFMPREEVRLLMEKTTIEHGEFDRRLTEQAEELGALREKIGR